MPAVVLFTLLLWLAPAFGNGLEDFSAAFEKTLRSNKPWLSEIIHPAKIRGFYENRKFVPVWLEFGDEESAEITNEARWFILTIARSETEGFSPAWYHGPALTALFEKLARGATKAEIGEAIALETLLSDAYLSYATDLARGLVSPSGVDEKWSDLQSASERGTLLAAQTLRTAAKAGELIEQLNNLAPADADYAPLKEALEVYQRTEQAGGWPRVPSGEPLRKGDRGKRVALLKWRLSLWSDPGSVALPAEAIFDDALMMQVAEFQQTHGLKSDGVAGTETIAMLNVPVSERVRQLKANLERLRWLPRKMEGAHVLVDIARFELQLRDRSEPLLTLPIIVGELDWKTPLFSSSITHLSVNPTWTIPTSILAAEIADKVARDPLFLVRQGIEVTKFENGKKIPVSYDDIDWEVATLEPSPYSFVQPPGKKNPLGSIKFVFPNRHAVYLHGTSDGTLFRSHKRTYSHGCIRVDKPVELADRLLRIANDSASRTGNALKSRQQLETLIQSGKTLELRLEKAVPIYLIYRTAWIDPMGRLAFRPDIYGWDQVVVRALDARKR